MNDKIKISVLTSLYRCEKYLDQYFSALLRIINLNEVEFIFIHNDATSAEKRIICSYLNGNKQINYQYVSVPREGLYKSWNRGIQMAKGEYVAVWNVDDVRYPDSLCKQCQVFDDDKEIALVYGNKEILYDRHSKDSVLVHTKNYKGDIGLKKFVDGAFIMWKKDIHKVIGFFDEQFFISGDQEFWYRVTSSFRIKKVHSTLGVFAEFEGEGLSKTRKQLQRSEKILVTLRYGFWTAVDIFQLNKVKSKYKIDHVLSHGKMTKFKRHSPLKLINIKYILVSFLYSFSSRVYPDLFINKVSRKYF